MRNLLAFLAAAALTVAGLGWYLDWYQIRSAPAAPGHRSVHIDIDTKKINEDVHKGAERGAEKLHKILEKKRSDASGSAAGSPSQPETTAPTTTGPRIIIQDDDGTREVGPSLP